MSVLCQAVPLAIRTEFVYIIRMKEKNTTKLTLAIDPSVIKSAKSYAASINTSVSGLVEAYLRHLTSGEGADTSVDPATWPPLTRSLHARLQTEGPVPDYDSLRDDYLIRKNAR